MCFWVRCSDTAISMEEEETPEEVKENMRLNKQIIETIKLQPWRMKKNTKLYITWEWNEHFLKKIYVWNQYLSFGEKILLKIKLAKITSSVLNLYYSAKQPLAPSNVETQFDLCFSRKAKTYVRKHEGELAQSKRSKDVLPSTHSSGAGTLKKRLIIMCQPNSIIYLLPPSTYFLFQGWNRFKREVANFMVMLTPWEMRIKRIESHFGSVVASYFTFLRWVFWINCFISAFVCCFLMVPEVLRGAEDPTGMRKEIESEEKESALNLKNIWDFEGYLKYSPIFYGYYSNREKTEEGYRVPLAYFLTSIAVYIFSFFAILRRMAENSRMSKLSEKDDECTFAWKLFTGWDYMIGNPETAYNKVASLVMGFKGESPQEPRFFLARILLE
ncbi:transmembrane channel-like protein 3 [Caerostris extrusa]|uniref:Transmembrane channel-like protein 3 n=1 Tax=Caerostris extrusa TaxID=172846 RepID=A0AAV4NGA3_CAEEX|nr:transmembrane channel-like protein 3 [Caerostris extrusa]